MSTLNLTPRERQVAALVARGLPNRQIAAELGCAANTVNQHMHMILAKNNLHSRVDLAVRFSQENAG